MRYSLAVRGFFLIIELKFQQLHFGRNMVEMDRRSGGGGRDGGHYKNTTTAISVIFFHPTKPNTLKNDQFII